MSHPTWCGQQHADDADHRSDRFVVELPYREAAGVVLAASEGHTDEPHAELVTYYVDRPVLDVTDPAVLGALVIPATHLAQLAGALSELATLATPGGTR